jgi:hypothetical protein
MDAALPVVTPDPGEEVEKVSPTPAKVKLSMSNGDVAHDFLSCMVVGFLGVAPSASWFQTKRRTPRLEPENNGEPQRGLNPHP